MRAHPVRWALYAMLLAAAPGWSGRSAATGAASPGIRNYYRLDGRRFRFESSVIYCAPAKQPSDGATRVLAQVPVELVLGPDTLVRYRPRDLRVIDRLGARQPYSIVRAGSPVGVGQALRTGDLLCVSFPAAPPDARFSDVVVVLFGAGTLAPPAEYGQLHDSAATRVISVADDSSERGLIDYTGPVDLRNPASRIQLDLIYSARWNLWYEFAQWSRLPADIAAVPPLIAVPLNPLSESTHFNMDDVPRFPLYYLRYHKQTGDRDALRRSRLGLETILHYTRADGTMPYMLAPWSGQHSPPGQLVDTYHSMRAVAEGIPAFRSDKEFADRLRAEYELLRRYMLSRVTGGLFFGRASGNGAVIEAVYHRWLDTRNAREIQDIRLLADAICTPDARAQRADFGESIPWVPIGLSWAYRATSDPKYLREAESWLNSAILPSLRQDRRYYTTVPDLKRSGATYGENPLSVWYHSDSLLLLYEATGDKRYYDLAAWVLGDCYDLKRYGERAGARIVDTGDPITECWGNACAEDALRMIAKYLWQARYPKLWADARARRDDQTGPMPAGAAPAP